MSGLKNWNGDACLEQIHGEGVAFVTRAAEIVERRAKELLSISGTGQVKGMNRGPIERSKPGEPPRKQTGDLRRRVTHEVNAQKVEARVGTNYPVGKYLELGTRRGLLPRPWLRRALVESKPQINRISGRL